MGVKLLLCLPVFKLARLGVTVVSLLCLSCPDFPWVLTNLEKNVVCMALFWLNNIQELFPLLEIAALCYFNSEIF